MPDGGGLDVALGPRAVAVVDESGDMTRPDERVSPALLPAC
jgi:hypothetical protein